MSSKDLCRWTCERCKESTYTEPGRAPQYWVRLTVQHHQHHPDVAVPPSTERDLCQTCARRILDVLQRPDPTASLREAS